MKYFGLSVIALLLCFVCSGAIAVDEAGGSPPRPSSSRTASDQSGTGFITPIRAGYTGQYRG